MVNFIQKHQNTSNIVRLCIFCSAIAASGNTPRRRAMCSFHCAHTHGLVRLFLRNTAHSAAMRIRAYAALTSGYFAGIAPAVNSVNNMAIWVI